MHNRGGGAGTVDSALVRQINRSRIFHVLLERPGCTQKDLAAETGLTAGTVSNVIRELRSEGVVTSRRRARESGEPGRPGVELHISEQAGLLAGVQIDMRFITLVITTLGGRVLAHDQLESGADLPVAVDTASTGIRELLAGLHRDPGELLSVGVGVTGLVDERGHLIAAPYQTSEWRDVELSDLFQARLPAPIYVDNDDKVVAMGERLFGAARGVETFVVLNGYAGIGGSVYYHGSVLRGRSNLAGEIGHIKVVRGGRRCGCGGTGCLSAHASMTSITRILRERGVEAATTASLLQMARAGHSVVLEVVRSAATHLGRVAAMLVNTVSPDAVVISGELAKLAPLIVPIMYEVMREDVLEPFLVEDLLRVSPLGELAVPLGGVALALDGYLGVPRWVASNQA